MKKNYTTYKYSAAKTLFGFSKTITHIFCLMTTYHKLTKVKNTFLAILLLNLCLTLDVSAQNNALNSISEARNVADGTYSFDINGNTFTAQVQNGWVMVVNEVGPASNTNNLATVTTLNSTVRGILSPNTLANLGGIAQLRLSSSDRRIDATTANATLINRVKTNTTLNQGINDNTISSSWTGTGASNLSPTSVCVTTSGNTLPQNIIHPCGDTSSLHWIPSSDYRRISAGSTGNVNDGVSFSLWVKGRDNPGGVIGTKLWLDASDIDGDGLENDNPADATAVTTWVDKSGNGNDVTPAGITGAPATINAPTYLNNQFNGKGALRFDNGSNNALGSVLSTPYTGDFTVFLVLESQVSNPTTFQSFFSSSPAPTSADNWQIDFDGPTNKFELRAGGSSQTLVPFGDFNNELNMYTVRFSGNQIETYSDGQIQNQSAYASSLGFNAYRIGVNRGGNLFFDSKIAEVIVYQKALTPCELEKVNLYLGKKYGRDFNNVATNYDFGTTFPGDISGIGAFTSSCSGLNTIDSASSSILKIDNPSSNNAAGEFFTFGHDNGSLTEQLTDLPVSLVGLARIGREWKVDLDGDVGTIDLEFNTMGLTLSGTDASDFKLLIDTDGNGDFSVGQVTQVDATAFANNVISFPGVTIPDGAVITFSTGVNPVGPGVLGANLWLKANEGTTQTASNLTGWVDQTGINTFTKQGTIGYEQNQINFNPVVRFNNSNSVNTIPSNTLNGNTAINYVDGFAVYKHTNVNSSFLGGVNGGVNYSQAIFASSGSNTAWVGNGSNLKYSHFNATGLDNSFNLVNLDVSRVAAPYATGSLNGATQNLTNGTGSDYSQINFTPMIGGGNNKGSNDGWGHMRGDLAEVVLFPSSLSQGDKNKVQSYLAIKYGISLDPSINAYTSSTGTVLWNETTYWNDVFGIGKDDASSLEQTSSNSINTGSGNGTGQSGLGNIVISNPSSLDDGDYLMLGHNNGALTEQTTDLPTSATTNNTRIARQWKVSHTGDVGTVDLAFSLEGLCISGVFNTDYTLLIDEDGNGNFLDGTITTVTASALASNILTFSGLTLNNNAVFTIQGTTASLTLTSDAATTNQTGNTANAITNIEYSTTNISAATVTGLPAGVTAAYDNIAQTIIISGTPTATGTFNYTVNTTSTQCSTSPTATGTIIVNVANTVSTGSSNPTINHFRPITPITHTTTGATGIGTPAGLPPGITATWMGDVITISGKTSRTGTYNYSIPLTGGSGTGVATGTITVIDDGDFDGDGVIDTKDLDADNDGILNTDEGYGGVVPSTPISTYNTSVSTRAANGPVITTPTNGYVITDKSQPGKFAFDAISRSENGEGGGTGTISFVTIDVDFAQSETVSNVDVNFRIGSKTDANGTGYFDDGIYIEVNGVVIVNFNSSQYGNSAFNSRFDVNGGGWAPWVGEGNPSLELDLVNRQVRLLADTKSGGREDALPFITNSKPNPIPTINFEAGVTIGTAYNNENGPGGIGVQKLSFSADITTHVDSNNDGIYDYLDIDVDEDTCFDTNEAYGAGTDTNGNGQYGDSPTLANGGVNANGLVIAAGIASSTRAYLNKPLDSNNDGIYDFNQVSKDVNSITTQPVDATVEITDTATFTVAADVSGTGLDESYQWQVDDENGTFSNLTDTGKYSGTNTATLSITNPSSDMGGFIYRVLVSKTAFVCESPLQSNTARLNVTSHPIVLVDDTYDPVLPSNNGDLSTSILDNDTLSGTAINANDVIITILSDISANGIGGGLISFNTATSKLAVAPGLAIGTYVIEYQICEKADPTNCAAATATIVLKGDNDADGIIDEVDLDDDNDGILDTVEDANNNDLDNDGIINSFDPDTDGDGCNDINEAYGNQADSDGDGVYGTGNPTVDANGLVIAAGVTGAAYDTTPADRDADSTADYLQTSQSLVGFTTQPANAVDVLISQDAIFTVTPDVNGTGTNPSYQWQEQVPAGSWTDITDNAIYSGATTESLTITSLQTSFNNNLYRVIVSTPSVICDTELTSNSAKLTIKSNPLVATADNISVAENNAITLIADVLANDTVNGVQATTTNSTITLLSTLNSGLTFDVNTGEVATDGSLTPGTYTIEYQICEVADPTNCTTNTNKGVVTIVVLSDLDGDKVGDINDLDDDNDGILDSVEDAGNNDFDADGTINSQDTDSDNDNCNDTFEVYGAGTDFGTNPAVDANGLVIAAGITGNAYTNLPVDIDNNGNSDYLQTSKTVTGFSSQPKNHITNINKSVNFNAIVTSSGSGTGLTFQWQEQINGAGPWTDITNNANYAGATTSTLTVTPPDASFNGNKYRLNVSSLSYACDTGTSSGEAELNVISHVINANSDNATVVEKRATSAVVNVITNDQVNHAATNLTDLNLSQVNTTNPAITLDITTGEVNVTAAATEGVYFIEYQICEKIDPTNCAVGSVTIVVQKDTDLDGIPDATDPDIDNDGNPNATDSNASTPVANNDVSAVKIGQATEIDILANDDFLPGAGITITQTGGTAVGTVSFDNLTGKLSYTPTLAEAGKSITIIYEVTNTATSVSKSAEVTLNVNDESDISISISVDNLTPNVGNNVVFTITTTNNGPSNASNIDVVSAIPTGYTFVSAVASAGTYDETTGNWFIGDINNGDAPTLVITATVNASGNYTQSAEVNFADQSDPDSTPGNGNETEDDFGKVTLTSVAQANLVTILSVDNASPNEGDDITYQIRVTNNGPSDASGIQVTSATIPSGITYKSDDGSGDYNQTSGIWTIGNLASGSSRTLHIVGTIDAGEAGNTINQTIATSLTETDASTTGDVLAVDVNVNQAAITTTIAVDNTTPNEGDTITYTISVSNAGANSATGIALTSVLPAGVTYVSDNGSGTYNPATGIWNPTNIASGGSAALSITATVNSGTAGTGISANVSAIKTDQKASNTLPAASATITVKSIDLVTTIAVDNSTPNVGDAIKYTININNSGADAATNVVLTDILPTGVTYVSDNSSGAYVSATGVWTVGTIAAGNTATIEITATIDAGTSGTNITNTISNINANETDSSVTGDVLSSTITITNANLVTVVSIPNSTPNVNDSFDYVLTVTNNGPSNATGVSLTSLVPSGLTYSSNTASTGTSYDDNTGVWTIGNITSGGKVTLTIKTVVNANQGNVTNTINTTAAAGNQTDSSTTGDVLSKSFTPTSANLITVFSVNNPSPKEGDNVIFTVKVRNVGPSDETNVSITTDTWPITGVTYLSDDSVGAYDEATGVWTIGNIANGNTATLNITGTVNNGTGGSTYNFKANSPASGDQTDTVTTGDNLTTNITVQEAKLATSISVNNSSPNEGATVVYTVTVTNNGPSTDNNVSLTSLVPNGLTFVSSTPSQGTYNSGSGLWNIGSLANGDTETLLLTTTVNTGTGGSSITSSTSAALGDTTDTSVVNPNLSTTINVTSANLVTVKTVNNTLPDEGDTIIYTINVTNNGPNDETNVSLTDALPTGVTFVSAVASTGSYVNGTGVWTIGSIANGDTETLAITVTVDAGTTGTSIVNTTTAASGDQSDPTTVGDNLSASITVSNSDIITVLTVNNTTPNVGDTVKYTINVTNNGPNNDTNVSLTTGILSTISGLTFVSDDAGTDYDEATGVWTIGAIPNGDTKTLNITATVDNGTGGSNIDFTTTAAVGDQGDSSALGDVLSATINVSSANLVTTIVVDNSNPNIGDTVKYTINIVNNGPNDETNVSLENQLPTGVTYTSSNPSIGSYSSATGVWTIGNISKFNSVSLELLATVDTGTNGQTITNTISQRAVGDQSDPTTSGDNLSASLTVSSANLITVISVDNPTPNEGDTVQYTITVTNNGPNDVSSVDLTSSLPNGLSFNNASSGSYVSSTGIWSVGNIAKNTSETLVLNATVDSGAALSNSIVTTTTAAQGNITDTNKKGDQLSVTIAVTQSDLITVIAVDNPTPNEGGTIQYTITVTNNGPNDETNASLSTVLPTGLTYVSDNGSGAYNHTTGLWSIGNITKNTSEALVINAKVNTSTGGSTITTTTTAANGDQADPSTTSDVLSTDITISNLADVVLSKTVDNATPNAGDTINYTISVTNAGPTNVTNLVISDVLPAGLSFVNEFAGTGVWDTSNSTWTLATLPKGETRSLLITAKVDSNQGGNTIVNTISNTQDQTDSNITLDDNSESIKVTSVDLFATKTVNNSTPNEGETISYTITVTNKQGSSTATNVSITDILPTGVTYVSNTTTVGSYNPGSGLWSIGDLNNGASAKLIIDAKVNTGTAGTTITNTASNLIVDQSDTNTTADNLSAPITVTSSDLVTTKTVNESSPTEGQDIIYTISVTNNAGGNATNVSLTDRLPNGVTYKSDDSSGSYNSISGIWTIGNITAGATETINITATVNSGTGNSTITNTTTAAKGDQADPTVVGDQLTATINVVSADLVTTNTINVSSANIGDTVIYTLSVTNNGPSTANNITLVDVLPTGVTYVSDTGSGSYNSSNGTWTIGTLNNGANASINISATVDNTSGGKTINNVISQRATGTEADLTTANDVLSSSFVVISNDLETNITVNKATPNEGETISYTLTVKNNGPSNATGVTITDNLPSGISYVSHSTVNGTFNNGAGIWSIGNLSKNATATLTINATINSGTGGTTITNTTSSATADNNDPVTTNNADNVSITVGNSADVVLTNTVNNNSPNVGDTVIFTVTATNNGPSLVQNLIVKNSLPKGLTYGTVTPSNGTWTSPNWTISSLPSGVTETLTITATVDASTGGKTLTNVVSNTQNQTDSNLTSDDFNESVTVTNTNLITTISVNNTTPNEGDLVTYSINVENDGPSNATGVSLTDLLPSGVTYVSDDASGAYNTGSGIWSIGTINNGSAIKLNIVAKVNTGTGGSTIVNTTTLAQGNQSDLTTNGDNLTAVINVTSAELVTTLNVNNTMPNEGDLVTYSVLVNNRGGSDATNVSLIVNLPNGVTYNSFTAPAGTSYNQATGLWTIGTLASTNSKTLQIVAKVNVGTAGTKITTTTLAAHGDQTDPNLVADRLTRDITIANTSDIAVSKTVNNPTPNVGDTVTYTIVVENKSGAQVTNFVLTDVLPNGITLGNVTVSKGVWNAPNWTIATLDVNDPQTLIINAIVESGTGGLTLTNSVSHTQNQTDLNTTADDLTESITVTSSDLVTELTVNNPTPNEGDTIIYTLKITNNGPNNADGISLIDNLPTGVTYISHKTSTGNYNSGSGQWNNINLANGATETMTITATVNTGTRGKVITNTTSVATGNQSDPTTSGDVRSASIQVTSSNLVTQISVDNTTPNEGDTIVYSIKVTNNGTSDASNVTLNSILPAELTYVSDDSAGNYNATTGVWLTGNVTSGSTKTLKITATVNTGTGTLQTPIINNTSAAIADQADPTTVGDILSVNINVTSSDLKSTITVNNTTPNVGNVVTYTIKVINNGPSIATNVLLTDVLPSGVTYVSDDGSGDYDNNTGLWNIGTLQNGGSRQLKISASVDANQGGNAIINTINIAQGDQSDPISASDISSATINVTSSDLVTQKTVTTSGFAGTAFESEVIKYTITVINNGGSNATNVSLTDVLPVGVTYRNHNNTQGIYNNGSGNWIIGNINSNATATLNLFAIVDAGQAGNTITNTASVAIGDQSDPTTNGDILDATVTVNNSSDIVLNTIVDNASPNEGDTVTYTITATNKGPAMVTNLEITDLLPSGLSYGVVTPSTGSWSSPIWTIGTLTSGSTATLTIKAIVATGTGGQTLVNTITKTHDQVDTDSTTDVDAVSITVTSTELVTRITSNLNFANENDKVIYTIQVENQGNSDATNVHLTNLLPNGLTYVSDDSNGTYNTGSGLWIVGSLANGDTATLNITAKVNVGTSGQTITNTTTAAIGNQSDPSTTGDVLSKDIVIKSESDIAITHTVDINNPNEGNLINYTVTVSNNGGASATNLVVDNVLPNGLSYINATVTKGNWNAPSWTVGSLAPGEAETLTISVMVNAGTNGLTLTSTVSNSQDQVDTNITNDDLSEDITVTSIDLEVYKTVNVSSPNIGDTVTYTINVINNGPDNATGVSLNDVLPIGVTYVGHSTLTGTYNQGSGLWNIGNIDNGDTVTLVINATVNNGTLGVQITNIVTNLIADQADYDNTNNTDSAAITPGSTIDLSLSNKVINSFGTPKVGDIVTYELIVSNSGVNRATGVEVTDLLPSGVRYVKYTSSKPYDPVTGIWNVGNVDAGDLEILFIEAEVLSTGSYINCSEITKANEIDSDSTPGNGISTEDDYACAIITPGTTIDLSLSNKVINSVGNPKVGDIVTYELTVSNSGVNRATGVEVTDLLPSGVRYVKYTSSKPYDPVTGIWNVGDVDAGDIEILFIEAEVLSTGSYTNCSEITKANEVDSDSTPGNGISTEDDYACAIITPVNQADLELTMVVDNSSPVANTTVDFTISLDNLGPNTVSAVTIEAIVPSGYTFKNAITSSGSYDSTTGEWSITNINANDTETITITAIVLATGDWVFSSEITSSSVLDPDSTPGNNDTSEDDYAEVSISPDVKVNIPESFTPNGDGINDVFIIKDLEVEYPKFRMEIRNRYGYVVYQYQHNGNPNTTPRWWDGNSEGFLNTGNSDLPTGTYFYTIYYNDGDRTPKTGWVYLRK